MNKKLKEEIAKIWDEPLPKEEFERRLALARAELEGPEGENLHSLIAWFSRRYPTTLDRLRYARRKSHLAR